MHALSSMSFGEGTCGGYRRVIHSPAFIHRHRIFGGLGGTPAQAAIQGDTRGAGQRNHDALLAAARALLASGKLGQHNGLPASIIVTTTLQELEAGAGKALTGGGTRCRCPM